MNIYNHKQKINEAVSSAYVELAFYLKLIRGEEISHENIEKRAERFRTLNDSVKRINFSLKYFSTYGLILSLLSLLISNMLPEFSLKYVTLSANLFIVSIFIKLFSPLVDLETKIIQYIVVGAITGFFILLNPPFSQASFIVAGFYIIFITLSRSIKRNMKISTSELMMYDPERYGVYLNTKSSELLEFHQKLGIANFDSPIYQRSFRVTSFKKKRGIEPDPIANPTRSLPPKGTVRVEVWKRDPLRDLSSIYEFLVCCFLGGSQDASAFDFMMSKSLTMLDMVSPKGRTIRVLLMACVQRQGSEEKPVLVVNAVFGREGGLVGSLKDDDPFIGQQIEAYARFTGFEKIIYNLTSTNKRPRLFIDYLKEHVKHSPVRSKCRLTSTASPIKLEIFNRREPISNLYVTLFLEMMNLTNNYATQGKVLGFLVDLKNVFMQLDSDIPSFTETEAYREIKTGGCCLRVDSRLVGETSEPMLKNLFNPFPEINTAGLPKPVVIKISKTLNRLVDGSALDGTIKISPALLTIKDRLWMESIFSIALCQHFLWLLHPVYEDDLLFTFIDHTLPAFNKTVLESLIFLNNLDSQLKLAPSGNFVTKIIVRAVREKYRTKTIFKYKEIYAFIQEEISKEGSYDAGKLARDLFYSKLKGSPGFRGLFFNELDDEQKQIVYEVMIQQLEEFIEDLLIPQILPEDFSLTSYKEIEEKIFHFEKTTIRYQIDIDRMDVQKIDVVKKRCKLLGQLADVERLIEKNRSKKALSALREIKNRRSVDIKEFKLEPVVISLKRRALFVPLTQLVEKLNMDMYW
jgi:hypothetical protein